MMARLVAAGMLGFAVAGCSTGPDPATLKVPTHTVYNSGTSADVSGKLTKDARGCLMLVDGAGRSIYAVFPLKFVTTTDSSLTFDGRTYQLGDVVSVAGGGPAETVSGFSSPSICPSTGVTFVSPPGS